MFNSSFASRAASIALLALLSTGVSNAEPEKPADPKPAAPRVVEVTPGPNFLTFPDGSKAIILPYLPRSVQRDMNVAEPYSEDDCDEIYRQNLNLCGPGDNAPQATYCRSEAARFRALCVANAQGRAEPHLQLLDKS